jgi:hypothetical protein
VLFRHSQEAFDLGYSPQQRGQVHDALDRRPKLKFAKYRKPPIA